MPEDNIYDKQGRYKVRSEFRELVFFQKRGGISRYREASVEFGSTITHLRVLIARDRRPSPDVSEDYSFCGAY
jgi:hypothetical protein